jgi:hypothetical protein
MPVQKPRSAVTQEALCAALMRHAGNKTAAAIHLGIYRGTVRKLMLEYGLGDKPLSGGYGKPLEPNVLPLPPKGEIFRYLLTSAQNNTKVFNAFLKNLEAYKEYKPARLMISRFTYNKTAYDNAHMAKPGRRNQGGTDEDGCWYDQSIAPYVCDGADSGSGRYQLAPDLQWCAELNILPTAVAPLSDLDVYAGHNSAIFPHAKVAMRSMPRMPNDAPRYLYTTGTVTQLNYIQRKAGQKAEFHHIFGALIVEVNSEGDWWVRQINASSDGSFYDCPGGNVVRVSKGRVTEGHRALAIGWGDVHASEIDAEVSDVNWGRPGAIDSLRPSYQFMNDLFSMRSRSHHETKKFGRMYSKYIKGQDSVLEEVQTTRQVMQKAHRPWCKTVVVSSNHDRHGERWLDEADYRYDLPNVKFFLEAQLARVSAIEADGPKEWCFLEWALNKEGCPRATFLGIEESFLIGPKGHQVECGLHGDIGPNGARGSTRNLAKLGRRNNKGHDHQATIYEGTYSAGVCQLDLTYNKGPTSWSVSHILTYTSGKRCILSQRAGRLWA